MAEGAAGTCKACDNRREQPGDKSNAPGEAPRLFLAAASRGCLAGNHVFEHDHQFSPAANFLSFQNEGYSKDLDFFEIELKGEQGLHNKGRSEAHTGHCSQNGRASQACRPS